jgi:hypothetical protein
MTWKLKRPENLNLLGMISLEPFGISSLPPYLYILPVEASLPRYSGFSFFVVVYTALCRLDLALLLFFGCVNVSYSSSDDEES